MPVIINGTTGISGVDGTAASPAVEGGDTDTGLFFPAAGAAAISTNGVERMRVDGNGQVLIGASSPTTIASTSAAGVQLSGGATAQFQATRYSVDANPARLMTGKSRSASIQGQTIVQNGDALFEIVAAGSDGTSFITAAGITVFVDGTPGTGDMPGRIAFSTTADGFSVPAERFRIAPLGQLGIGGANYGTAGQVLTSGGASAAPSWANVETPKLNLIGTINVGTGTSASLSGLNLTGYNFVNLYFNGVSNTADGSYLVGTSTADDVTATPTVPRANTLIGYMVINLLDGTGFFSSSASSLAFDTPVVKASTSISVANSTGNFDAGSILVYGVN